MMLFMVLFQIIYQEKEHQKKNNLMDLLLQ